MGKTIPKQNVEETSYQNMKHLGILAALFQCGLTLVSGQVSSQTLKCTHLSSTGIKAVRTFEYIRNEQRIGTELISTCSISESILVNDIGHWTLDLGTRIIAEIDCNWTPLCYKENERNSGPSLYRPEPRKPKSSGPTLYKPEPKSDDRKPKSVGPTLYVPSEPESTGPTLYRPEPESDGRKPKSLASNANKNGKYSATPIPSVRPTGPSLYNPQAESGSRKPKSFGPTLYTPGTESIHPSPKDIGPTLYKPETESASRKPKYSLRPEPESESRQPKILAGPSLYTPATSSNSQSQKSTGPSLYRPEGESDKSFGTSGPSLYRPEPELDNSKPEPFGPILGPTFYTPGPDTSRIPRQPEPEPEILTPTTHIHHHYKPSPKSPRPTTYDLANKKRNAKSQKDEEFEELATAALVLGGGAIAGALFGQALNIHNVQIG